MPGAQPVPAGAAAGHVTTGPSSPLRRDLLFLLRQVGPSSPEVLAKALGASRTGVLQQLRGLEAVGLVAHQTVRHGVGRPRHVYDLAAAAQSLFPTNYDGLAADLLSAVEQVGGAGLVAEVFAARRAQVADRIRVRMAERVPAGAPLVDRVRELAVIQDELGYLADVTLGPDGAIRLREHNCAIYDVACDQPAACEAELDLFREVLGGQVVRETHIAAGDRCCCYAIRPS